MVKKFTDLRGKASSGVERFKFADGVNTFRIVSEVMPGYKYWKKTPDGTNVPLDCLSFDREKEKFVNSAEDPVRKYFPDEKCSWAYSSFAIDRSDNKLKLIDHKKKLFEQILALAKKLGDPTDHETGWDIVVERERTGPKPFNVEYHLDQIESMQSQGPLSDDDKKLLKDMPNIEDFLKRPTPEEQDAFIREKILGEGTESDEEAEEEFETASDDLE